MMTQKIALFSNLSGTVRNRNCDPTPELRKHALSKPSTKPAGIGRKITLADGTETTQVLSDAQIEIERKRRGRLPYGFGTKVYQDGMAKHRALKRAQEQERNARREAIQKKRELSDTQESFVSKELARVEGRAFDFRGRLLEAEATV